MIFLFLFEIFHQKSCFKKQYSSIILLSTNLLNLRHDVARLCVYVPMCLYACLCVSVYLLITISYFCVHIYYKELQIIISVVQGTN